MLKMGESPLTKQALRIFRDKVDQRIKRLLQRYAALLYAIPNTQDFQLPSLRPARMPGESAEQYRQRVAQGFLRRAAVLRRDISAYFRYAYQRNSQAIFTFVALAPRLTLPEPWVQAEMYTWAEAGETQSLLKLFGLFKGKRSPQHQVRQQVIYHCVHASVDLAKQRGMSTQAALASLADRPTSSTLDGERDTVTLSQSTYQAMYYNQGPYAGHDDATIASVVMDQRYGISAKVLSQNNARNSRYRDQTKAWVAKEI